MCFVNFQEKSSYFIERKAFKMNWRKNGGPKKPRRTKRSEPEERTAVQQDMYKGVKTNVTPASRHGRAPPGLHSLAIFRIIYIGFFFLF